MGALLKKEGMSNMTGKQLKAFAANLHDEAVIQIHDARAYRDEWVELEPANLRGVHTISPVEAQEQVPA